MKLRKRPDKYLLQVYEYYCPTGVTPAEHYIIDIRELRLRKLDAEIRLCRELGREPEPNHKQPIRYHIASSIEELVLHVMHNNARRVGTHFSVCGYVTASDLELLKLEIGNDKISPDKVGGAPLVVDRIVFEYEESGKTWRDLLPIILKLVHGFEKRFRIVPYMWHSAGKSIYMMIYFSTHYSATQEVLSRLMLYLARRIIYTVCKCVGLRYPKDLLDRSLFESARLVRGVYTARGDSMTEPLFYINNEIRNIPSPREAVKLLETLEPPVIDVSCFVESFLDTYRTSEDVPPPSSRLRVIYSESGKGKEPYRYIKWLLYEAPPLPDWRKRVIASIISSYLANVENLDVDTAWSIVSNWLERMGENPEKYYKYFIYNFNSKKRRGILPPSLRTLLEDGLVVQRYDLRDFVEWLRENYPPLRARISA